MNRSVERKFDEPEWLAGFDQVNYDRSGNLLPLSALVYLHGCTKLYSRS
jgi:hypothetical protein